MRKGIIFYGETYPPYALYSRDNYVNCIVPQNKGGIYLVEYSINNETHVKQILKDFTILVEYIKENFTEIVTSEVTSTKITVVKEIL